jgi:hypothetical protein
MILAQLVMIHPSAAFARSGERLIVGTCVEADVTQGAPDIHVMFVPDSTTAITDSEGDFLLTWSGRAGFLQIERPNGNACRRIAVSAAETEENLDLGFVRAPRGVASRTPELRKGSALPDSVSAPDPPPDSNRYWFLIRATFDLWGNLLDVTKQSGDPATPEVLVAAAEAWADTAAWEFRREASCEDPPFEATIPVASYWSSSAQAWIRDPDNRPR